MKLSSSELTDIKNKLFIRENEIVETDLVKLNTAFRSYISSFHTLYRTMCDEKMIKEDPYSETYKLSTLDVPDESPVPLNEEEYAMTIRLGHFNALLDYIKENIEFSLDFLNPLNIAKLFNIGTFINWDNIFHPQPEGFNTEALNQILFQYQKDINNTFVIATLKTAAKSAHEYSQEFLLLLSDIKIFIIELEKLWVRENILPVVKIPPEVSDSDKEKAKDIIRQKAKEFKHNLEVSVINGVLQEDFTSDGDKEREEKLNTALKVIEKKDQSNNKPKGPTKEGILENILCELTKVVHQINPIVEKLEDNSTLYRESTYGLIDLIVDFIKYSLFNMERETKFNIKVVDSVSNRMKEKELNFENFIEKLLSYNSKLSLYQDTGSQEYKKLFTEDNEDIAREVHALLSTTNYIHKTVDALDTLFKLDVEEPRGMQIELKAIETLHKKCHGLFNDFINLNKDQTLI